jgi:hypothetical protein
LITYFYFFSTHTLFNLFCTILTNPSMVNLTLVTYYLQKQNQTNNTQHRICEIHVSRYIFFCKVCARRLETKNFYFFSMHTLFNLFCTILTNPSMVNLTLVTYLLIELLTDTALSHPVTFCPTFQTNIHVYLQILIMLAFYYF